MQSTASLQQIMTSLNKQVLIKFTETATFSTPNPTLDAFIGVTLTLAVTVQDSNLQELVLYNISALVNWPSSWSGVLLLI